MGSSVGAFGTLILEAAKGLFWPRDNLEQPQDCFDSGSNNLDGQSTGASATSQPVPYAEETRVGQRQMSLFWVPLCKRNPQLAI